MQELVHVLHYSTRSVPMLEAYAHIRVGFCRADASYTIINTMCKGWYKFRESNRGNTI